MDKVLVISRSLRCFRWSWFGLIPLLGVIPALIAISLFHKVRDETGDGWNPAHFYVICGFLIATGGLLFSSIFGCVLVVLCFRSLLH